MKRKPATRGAVRPPKRKTRHRPKATTGTLGASIRTARAAKGLTQLALAHAIGYEGDDAGAYISRVESGHQSPRIDTLSRIADALGVAVCSLLPQTGNSSFGKTKTIYDLRKWEQK